MNVLVTGGAGYIGSHAAKALARAGHQPIVYDNLSRGHRNAVRWGPLVEGDIRNGDLVRQTLRAHRIDAVMHFAALAYVGESMTNPGLYFDNNAAGSLCLLEAMCASNCDRIVFSSTCATYGTPLRVPIDESHPQAPVNAYGESKLFVEKLLRWYGEIHGLRWMALRYFNAAGADPDGEIGEIHNPETHVIPLAIEAALHQERPLRIFGTDYGTPDGTAIRDYIHVADLATAHLLALDYLTHSATGVFNLGTGRGHSVREVIQAVERLAGRKAAVEETARRLGDPPVLVADASKASRELLWRPTRSSLESIVETAWKWHASSP